MSPEVDRPLVLEVIEAARRAADAIDWKTDSRVQTTTFIASLRSITSIPLAIKQGHHIPTTFHLTKSGVLEREAIHRDNSKWISRYSDGTLALLLDALRALTAPTH